MKAGRSVAGSPLISVQNEMHEIQRRRIQTGLGQHVVGLPAMVGLVIEKMSQNQITCHGMRLS